LLEVLDPFPDYAQHLVGFPDRNQAKSVVQKVKKSFTVSCPASVTTPTFDAVIFFSGNLYPGTITDIQGNVQTPEKGLVYSDGSLDVPSGDGYYPIQTFTSYVVPAGAPVFPDSPSWADSNVDRYSGISFSEYVFDRTRLLGGGVEVTNTTPELYRGGMIGIADVSSEAPEIVTTILRSDNMNLRVDLPTVRFNAPPTNIGQFQQLPGKVRWGAEEGCYAVLKMSKNDNDFEVQHAAAQAYFPSYPALIDNTTRSAVTGVLAPGTVIVATTASSDIPKQVLTQPPMLLKCPFDLKVIYLTGCDSHSTFQVDVNLILETIPDTNDVRFLSIASPAAPMDEPAIELYSRVAGDLPPAVPVSENASGGWFSSLCDVVSDWAPTVGSLFGPTGTAIGSGLKGIAGMAKGFFPQAMAKKRESLTLNNDLKEEKTEMKKLNRKLSQVKIAPSIRKKMPKKSGKNRKLEVLAIADPRRR